MADPQSKVGLIAGGGSLPIRIASDLRRQGRPHHIVVLEGMGDEALGASPTSRAGIAQVGKIIKTLRHEGCTELAMAGLVHRPNFAALRPDLEGAKLLPKVLAAARQGDGAILDVMVAAFEAAGFDVIGPETLLSENINTKAGALGKVSPTEPDLADIEKAAEIVEALGPFDVGQGAIVREGFVLAIEAAEGTDRMLARVASLNDSLDVADRPPAGVLVKVPKPDQERRVDLPTIGVKTIEGLKAANLRGVALRSGEAIIVDEEAVIAAADQAGVFVYVLPTRDQSTP